MALTSEHISLDRKVFPGIPEQIRPSETTDLLTNLIHIHDTVTAKHIDRVSFYVELLAEKMEFSKEELTDAVIAGRLHDLGKVIITEDILTKSGPLTDEEWEIIKEHSNYGAEIAKEAGFNENVVNGIKYHHERLDGRGYPEGLTGDEIPRIARIIAIMDTWDAMLSDRPYEESLNINVAVAELIQATDAQLDREMVIEFLKLLQEEGSIILEDINITEIKEHQSRNYDESRIDDYAVIIRKSLFFQ